ncbi:MAG: tRNA-guanosine(34) transglycosylase, partial [Chlamydiae bacterium]|nr:tRNA-guanosine(34) transglycosylase [Chlamydiota bacterium]
MSTFTFEVLYTSSKSQARVGRIHTTHGIIDTPGFVGVGTNGTLKGLSNTTVHELGLQLMFCNTYHMLLQPGTDVVRKAGGLHTFIRRDLPLITDSGGFQVFSLAYGSVAQELKSQGMKRHEGSVLKITEDGVVFRSYRDGTKIHLTPERSIQAQKDLGADIILCFDELPPYHMGLDELKRSLARTHRWEESSLNEHQKNPQGQALYAIIHGGIDPSLRQESCEFLTKLPYDGFAIGGSLGKNRQEMHAMLSYTMPRLPKDKPNHLLGIGDLTSLELCVPLGIDTFDSSYPTKAARHGILLTWQGPLNVTKTAFATHFSPPEEGCTCHTCQHYSLGYLHHLFKAKESTGMTLASLHNVH